MRKGFRKRKSIEKIAEQKSPFFNRKESKMNEVSSSFILQKGILPKLQIGKSNDYHEKQADKVADKVVNSNQPIQKQADEEPKAKFEINKQEEEEAQDKIDLRKQDEEEEAAQAKLQKQEEEDVQAKFDLRKQEEDEEPIQTK